MVWHSKVWITVHSQKIFFFTLKTTFTTLKMSPSVETRTRKKHLVSMVIWGYLCDRFFQEENVVAIVKHISTTREKKEKRCNHLINSAFHLRLLSFPGLKGHFLFLFFLSLGLPVWHHQHKNNCCQVDADHYSSISVPPTPPNPPHWACSD